MTTICVLCRLFAFASIRYVWPITGSDNALCADDRGCWSDFLQLLLPLFSCHLLIFYFLFYFFFGLFLFSRFLHWQKQCASDTTKWARKTKTRGIMKIKCSDYMIKWLQLIIIFSSYFSIDLCEMGIRLSLNYWDWWDLVRDNFIGTNCHCNAMQCRRRRQYRAYSIRRVVFQPFNSIPQDTFQLKFLSDGFKKGDIFPIAHDSYNYNF